MAVGTIRKNIEHQAIPWIKFISPRGDIESIEGAEKNDKLYPGGGDMEFINCMIRKIKKLQVSQRYT
ncbi:hypothetical protein DXF93_24035 [Escherichia coli]|nr:hypothetical protein DXF93_24035 [Escherichia coli]